MKNYIVSYESGSFIISKEKKLICFGNTDLVYNMKDPGVSTQEADLEKICKIGGLKKSNFIVESLTESFTALIINGYTFKFNKIKYKTLLQLEYEFERHPLCQIFRAFFRENHAEIRDADYPYFIRTKLELTENTDKPKQTTEGLSEDASRRNDKRVETTSSNELESRFLTVGKRPEMQSDVELNLIGEDGLTRRKQRGLFQIAGPGAIPHIERIVPFPVQKKIGTVERGESLANRGQCARVGRPAAGGVLPRHGPEPGAGPALPAVPETGPEVRAHHEGVSG